MNTPITTINISHQKVDIEAEYKTLVEGIKTELAALNTLEIGGQIIPRVDLIARFQARIDAAETVKAARGAHQKAVADERAVDAEVRPLRAATKVFLQGKYGKQSPALQKFGFTQGRKAKASVEAKAAGQAKAKATRAALGTKGKQQKKASKKAVTAPVAAPVNASSTGATAGGSKS